MHIVITGASSGIGAALARELATLPNAKLTLVARRRALLEELARSLPCEVNIVERDLSTGDARTTDWLPEDVDVLVNNAGVQIIGRTAAIDVEKGEASVELNLLAPLRLTRAVLPRMLAKKSGTIVDIASMAALAPTPGMTYYNASKAGLAAASEALRGELRGSGVNVVTVYPGIVATDMADAGLAAYGNNLALRLQLAATRQSTTAAWLSALTARIAYWFRRA
jgi:short-subunit dehydrogenase